MLRTVRLISALALLLACADARAQVGEYRNDFSIGANAGWMLSRMDFDPSIKQSYKQSPTVGVSARYVCEKYFSSICGVQAELNYAAQGWQELIEDGSGNTYKRNLHYLQLPILMQLGWGRERRGLKFVFEAGPQVGICLGESEVRGGGEWDTSNRPNSVVYQYSHDLDHAFDYGITGGIGIELSTAAGHFLLEGRYYYGLGDTYDNSKKGYFSRSANSAIIVKLNYLFDIVRTAGDNIK